MALYAAFESEAIANCEIAGAALFPNVLDHTDCATTGSGSVTTNLVHSGPCWEPNASDTYDTICALDQQCGEFYDCESEPIVLWNGLVRLGGDGGGETSGDETTWVPWTGSEELWSCALR